MTNVKVVSIDLWLTLIKPNPASHKARTRLLAQAFGVEPNDEFAKLVRGVSRELDIRSEETGNDYNCGDRIDLLALELGKPTFKQARRTYLVSQCQSSIRKNPPSLIDPHTGLKLALLREKGVKLVLVSNTGYPEAAVMRDIVNNLGIGQHFDLMLFSSEVGVAKPSPRMYQRICDAFNVSPSEILHIGDSRKADYEGARSFGARSLRFCPAEASVEHEQITNLDEVMTYVDQAEPVTRFPLFELTTRGEQVVDLYGQDFCPSEYSRFKHGDAVIQKKYGFLLADMFVKRFGAHLRHDPDRFVIAPFAYMHVPTAAGNMMEWFHERLGTHLSALGLPCVQRIHIHKHVTQHSQDHLYATVSDAERKRILDATQLSVDKARLAGRTVVLIDDILITGSSERKLHETVRGAGAREIVFLYVARMQHEIAAHDPGIESRLNQWLVKDLEDLQTIFMSGKYRINLRNCKFILESDTLEVAQFVRQLPTEVVRDLRLACNANSYYLEPKYVGTFSCIEAEYLRRVAIDSFGVYQGSPETIDLTSVA